MLRRSLSDAVPAADCGGISRPKAGLAHEGMYVARYGAPMVGTAVFIRTCQHTDGWTDLPKVAGAFVPAA